MGDIWGLILGASNVIVQLCILIKIGHCKQNINLKLYSNDLLPFLSVKVYILINIFIEIFCKHHAGELSAYTTMLHINSHLSGGCIGNTRCETNYIQ